MKNMIKKLVYGVVAVFFLLFLLLSITGKDIVDYASDIFGDKAGENIVYIPLWILAIAMVVVFLFYLVNAIINMIKDL